jgi:hypothetical protein
LSLFRNKHVLTASIVAPLLAVVAYFGTQWLLGEKPHAAEPGQSYPLVEKPNCRRSGGQCGLKNGDFELDIEVEWMSDERLVLNLRSAHPLDGVMVALVESEAAESRPVDMQPEGDDGRTWALAVSGSDVRMARIRLVASANQAFYYSDGSTAFFTRDESR